MSILRASAALLLCLAAHGKPRPDPLFQAIRNNDLVFLTAELARGIDVNTRNGRGATLLMHGAAYGSPEAFELLVDAGPDLNAKNVLGATALIWSATDARKALLLVATGGRQRAL